MQLKHSRTVKHPSQKVLKPNRSCHRIPSRKHPSNAKSDVQAKTFKPGNIQATHIQVKNIQQKHPSPNNQARDFDSPGLSVCTHGYRIFQTRAYLGFPRKVSAEKKHRSGDMRKHLVPSTISDERRKRKSKKTFKPKTASQKKQAETLYSTCNFKHFVRIFLPDETRGTSSNAMVLGPMGIDEVNFMTMR